MVLMYVFLHMVRLALGRHILWYVVAVMELFLLGCIELYSTDLKYDLVVNHNPVLAHSILGTHKSCFCLIVL